MSLLVDDAARRDVKSEIRIRDCLMILINIVHLEREKTIGRPELSGSCFRYGQKIDCAT